MEILQYTFFQHALLGSLLASILCGMIGTYIVTRRLVFISGGITHASFGGIGLGVYLGLPPILGAAVFALLSALGVQWLSDRNRMREDSAIAILWTLGMSIGILFSFLSPAFVPDLSSYLFGNILTIHPDDLWGLGLLTLYTLGVFVLFLKPIQYIAFDAQFARSQGLPVSCVNYLLMALIALSIVACLRMVGIVLVLSLLTIPQTTANLFTQRYNRLIIGSILLGWVSCLGGLAISYTCNVPSGACIILVSVLCYALARLILLFRPSSRSGRTTSTC